MGVILVFANACKKDEDKDLPVVTTTSVTGITQTTAKSGGNITSDGGTAVTARGVCWSTNQTPTLSDNKTIEGTGSGTFISNISGLSANTKYYVRAYATNRNSTAYGSAVSFTTQKLDSAGSFTDSRDGNVYQYITIGNQVWMAENLKYLPAITLPDSTSETIPCYYVYGYYGTDVNAAKATPNYTTYGVLYNWPAAMAGSASSAANPSGVKGVCPAGWHLPSDAEWTQLTVYLGGGNVTGGKLKSTGTIEAGTGLWQQPNTGATNETGFTGLPGGQLGSFATFSQIGSVGNWWSSTVFDSNKICDRGLMYNLGTIGSGWCIKDHGFSVRCVKD